ncbi:MAG TPA: MFS transporter [Acetobacteraceae bacterium]|nr:MFS transporter [Acetobacteraceae bacterium]
MESTCSRHGLNWLNFFVAAVQTGFGPFVSVYLTQQHWTQTDIGLVLSLGAGVALFAQLPAGALVDALYSRRHLTALALAVVGVSALMLAARPSWATVRDSQILHAVGSCVLTPAIAAITLSLCGHAGYSERLGVNARYASLGNAIGAALLGACSYYLDERAVFLVTAALTLPAILATYAVRPRDRIVSMHEHPATWHPQKRKQHQHRMWHIAGERGLHVFAACAVLFGLANAAMLPLALNLLSQRIPESGFIITAVILLPQAISAAGSPWVGRLAQRIGRKPVLLAGFLAVPLRGVLFAVLFLDRPGALAVVLLQGLDGISAMVFGLMLPLVAADVTQKHGFMNTAIGWFALAVGLGAVFSTTLGGWMADQLGAPAAFLGLSLAGALGVLLLAFGMPETRPLSAATQPAAVA